MVKSQLLWFPGALVKKERFLTSSSISSGSVNLIECCKVYNFCWHYSVVLSLLSQVFKQLHRKSGMNSSRIYWQLRANQMFIIHHIGEVLLHRGTPLFLGTWNSRVPRGQAQPWGAAQTPHFSPYQKPKEKHRWQAEIILYFHSPLLELQIKLCKNSSYSACTILWVEVGDDWLALQPSSLLCVYSPIGHHLMPDIGENCLPTATKEKIQWDHSPVI